MTSASKTTLEDFSRFISHQSHFLRQFPELLHHEFKAKLLGQIGELEENRGEAAQEIATILRVLSAAGLDDGQINEIARENNVDRSNVFQYRALLQAIIEQAPPQVRAVLTSSVRRDNKPADERRWRFWKR